METPDITPLQKLVTAVTFLLTSVLALVNAFDWYDISGEQGAAVLGTWTAFASVLVLADAVIRHGRSRVLQNPPKPIEALDTTENKLPV